MSVEFPSHSQALATSSSLLSVVMHAFLPKKQKTLVRLHRPLRMLLSKV